jgi:hypothetical protein
MADQNEKRSPADAPPDSPQGPTREGQPRWKEKGEDQSPRHEGPQPEGNGATGRPASFPPHP